ncbi:MAG TPA: iron chelate uptake ABC transporter family permease subunit [Patescibacteria group bacterium]|jgi:zinc/manganese transport system permease protein|nr:iron chelate uptake ABC transporter family permease subunit [Patescibacteria group bacterium]
MSEQIGVLTLPFVACLILTGIHAYLGIHVLSRKVIFVDIALAQIAALGATVAFLLGYDPRSEGAYYFSLCFAVLAAAIFALTRTRVERVPQEAIIGLTYAVASATAILLADISPHGAEHLKDLLAGSIVWVTPHQIIKTGILYSIIGAFHFIFRKTFLLISLNPEEAYARGIHVRFWDFLFYLSFGIVITSSVQIAGVLLVFCYLVAPAVFAVMFSDRLRTRLALGWSAGVIVSAVGLLFSYDRPSGPTIMVCFALTLILGGLVRGVFTSTNRPRAAATAGAGIVAVAMAGYGMVSLRNAPASDEHTHGGGSAHAEQASIEERQAHPIGSTLEDLKLAVSDSHPGVRAKAVNDLAARGDRSAVPVIVKALEDSSTTVRENAATALGALGDAAAVAPLTRVMTHAEEDEWVRLRAAGSVALLGETAGIPVLIEIARTGEARVARLEAIGILRRLSGSAGGAGAAPDQDSAAVVQEIDSWWRQNHASLHWDAARKVYLPAAR